MFPSHSFVSLLWLEPDETTGGGDGGDGWEAAYAEYLVEKEGTAGNERRLFREEEGTWEEQYAAHCAEKEAKLDEHERQRHQ